MMALALLVLAMVHSRGGSVAMALNVAMAWAALELGVVLAVSQSAFRSKRRSPDRPPGRPSQQPIDELRARIRSLLGFLEQRAHELAP